MKIRRVIAELFHGGRADVTNLTAAFPNYANAPNNEKWLEGKDKYVVK